MERAAGIGWVTVLICLIAQVVTELTMRTPYNPLVDAISDLGRTTCTPQYCSPLFWVLDGSLVLLGLSLALGGWLAHLSAPRPSWWSRGATLALSLGGIGMAVVGLFPENVDFDIHVAGAITGLVLGNVGAVLAGWALFHVRGHRSTGLAAIVIGAAGVAASLLSILIYGKLLPVLVGVGGGLERRGVEPLLLIMALSGGALLMGEDVLAVTLRRVRRSTLTAGRRPA
jgi:hypothetical membrane protein